MAERGRMDYNDLLDFGKMDIGPIFFKEISFFNFLAELAQVFNWSVVTV